MAGSKGGLLDLSGGRICGAFRGYAALGVAGCVALMRVLLRFACWAIEVFESWKSSGLRHTATVSGAKKGGRLQPVPARATRCQCPQLALAVRAAAFAGWGCVSDAWKGLCRLGGALKYNCYIG